MSNITIGTELKNKICPDMKGIVIKFYGKGMALISITDKHLTLSELAICLENWEVI